MKRKGRSRKSPLLMESPTPTPTPSPKSSILHSGKKPIAAASTGGRGGGVLRTNSSPPKRSLTSISDLKSLASSRFADIKSCLIDRSHSEILKDLEASHSRLHKRFKIQTQTCQQVMDEAEKDFKKMSERVNESYEAMMESYTEFMADAQATTSRVCKTVIPELSMSFESAIGIIQSRFGIPST